MIGGKVVETVPFVDERDHALIWVNCGETGVEDGRKCAVYVEDTELTRFIETGDDIWWQGGAAYWTPKGRTFWDKKVRRIGYSGVPRPVAA